MIRPNTLGPVLCLHCLDRQSRCVRRSYLSSSTYGESGDTWQLEYERNTPICPWHERGLFACRKSDLKADDVDFARLVRIEDAVSLEYVILAGLLLAAPV
jgi:hypothetical protein